jgi:ATP-dependent DNA helicase RecQ
VKNGKYEDGSFSDDLLEASFDLINNSEERNCIEWVSYVPSLRRPKLVKEFAEKLANKLALPIRTSLRKTVDTPEQKSFQNSHYQCKNVYTSIEATSEYENGPVLLVDDMFDSGWTLTVCGKMLRDTGVEAVYPFALATSAK